MSLKISDLSAFSSVTVGASGVTSKFQTMGSNTGGLAELYVTAGGGDALRLNTNFVNGNYIDINPYITGVSNGGLEIKQNGTAKFVITAGGNVGIGTTTDAGYKLDVNGSGRFTGQLISDYRLLLPAMSIGYWDTVNNRIESSTRPLLITSYSQPINMGIDGGTQFTIATTGRIGIGTTDPVAGLDNQSSTGTYRQNGLTTLVTNTLPANGTQARRFEIARMSIDYNDWNSMGAVEVELYEKYFSRGLRKKYSIYYGYVSNFGCNLTEMTGSGDNNFRVVLGPEVVVSGDVRYVSIYVEARYYSQVTAVLKTNRELQASNPPGAGGIWVNKNPSGTDIADFTADSAVYVGNIIGGNSLFTTGKVGIGNESPAYALDVSGGATSVASFRASKNLPTGDGRVGDFINLSSTGYSSFIYIGSAPGTDWKVGKNITSYTVAFPNFQITDDANNVGLQICSGTRNILIGSTTDAGYKLDVYGTGRLVAVNSSAQLGLFRTGSDAGGMHIGATASGFRIFTDAYNIRFTLDQSGNGTFVGSVTATGFFNSSDIRLKEIVDYNYNISDIKPISYLWKDSRDNKKHIGYSAQEVQKVMPDAVNENEDGILSVNYIEVLVAKIAELENRIKQLEK